MVESVDYLARQFSIVYTVIDDEKVLIWCSLDYRYSLMYFFFSLVFSVLYLMKLSHHTMWRVQVTILTSEMPTDK